MSFKKKIQKKSFGLKKIWIPCTDSKVPFCQNWKIAKMALLTPCMKFKKKIARKTLFEAIWICHLLKIFLTFPRVRQIQDLGQPEYKTEIFSKRTHKISKILFNVGSYELDWKAKLENAYSLMIRNCKNTVCVDTTRMKISFES